ncbi:hypothetical protein VTN00DRAFT_887 [Thermoascus crustaceus]|uniref:uncharacterized protein n=1 Tax=Thermoascus crustaceus TaxID=5088 RepID=UPI003742AD9F
MRPCVRNAVAMVSGILLEEAGKLNSQFSEGAGRVSSARPVFATNKKAGPRQQPPCSSSVLFSAAVILTGHGPDLRSGTTRAAPRAVPGARHRYIRERLTA